MKKLNLENKIFVRLTAIKQALPINKRSAWLCRCSCGKEVVVKTDHLIQGHTKSCGCLNNDKRKERAKNMYSVRIKYSPSEATARRIWANRYKDGPFELFLRLSQENCYYCGAFPNNKQNAASCDLQSSLYAKENGNFIYNGLDRIDPSKPHTEDNVVPCCKYCNYAKRERSFLEFLEWIKLVHNNINKIESEFNL